MNKNILIVLLLLSFLCVGCLSKRDIEGHTNNKDVISKYGIEIYFLSRGVDAVLSDETYLVVDDVWLQKFLLIHKEHVEKHNLKQSEFWDCDNFSNDLLNLAQMQNTKETGAESLAVGNFWYITDEGYGHSINVAFTNKGIIFIEPRYSKIIQLTKKEINSCLYVYF